MVPRHLHRLELVHLQSNPRGAKLVPRGFPDCDAGGGGQEDEGDGHQVHNVFADSQSSL